MLALFMALGRQGPLLLRTSNHSVTQAQGGLKALTGCTDAIWHIMGTGDPPTLRKACCQSKMLCLGDPAMPNTHPEWQVPGLCCTVLTVRQRHPATFSPEHGLAAKQQAGKT